MSYTHKQIATKLRQLAANGCFDFCVNCEVCEDDLIEAADMLEHSSSKNIRLREVLDRLSEKNRQLNLALKEKSNMLEQLAAERNPDAPVTVSSTEQDLGALVEHFKAKAEKSYADGVRDAEKALNAAIRRGVFIDKLPDHVHALLTEKDND